MFPGTFEHIRLLGFDPYDVALSKLERNIQRDRDDVKYLARTVPFDLDVLKERYERELRPILGNPDREDQTLRLWREAIEEERSQT
jgi:U3 small nucleolar RNA-associated protein 14